MKCRGVPEFAARKYWLVRQAGRLNIVQVLKSARQAENIRRSGLEGPCDRGRHHQAVRESDDDAVREYSAKFNQWSPNSFRLSGRQLQHLVASVPTETIAESHFAHDQVRNFAQHQRAALVDVEVATPPGVFLGHRMFRFRASAVTFRAGATRWWLLPT